MSNSNLNRKAKLVIFGLICIAAVTSIAIIIGIPFLENHFIYYPSREFTGLPSDFGIEFEDVYFRAEDGVKLHGWYVPSKGAKSVILFFHGNAGNISDRLDNIIQLRNQAGVDVFIIDYHGYGKSEGSPNEKNLYMDGRAAMKELRRRLGKSDKKVIVFGRSLGGAVAVDVASGAECDALILESTFTSMPEIAGELFPIPHLKKLICTKFDSISKIGSIKAPKMIIHGENDTMISISHGQRLFKEATEPKEFYPIPGADHNNTYITAGNEYFRRVAEFIRRVEK